MDIARPPDRTPDPTQEPIFCKRCGGTPERKKRIRVKIGMVERYGPCGDPMHFKKKGRA